MIKIEAPALQVYQNEVFKSITKHWEDSIHTILSPRQYGKSYLINMLILNQSLNYSSQTSMIIEPTLAQSRKMANELHGMVERSGVVKSYNSQLLELKFINGSEVLFKSSDQGERAIRGYTISKYGLLVFDEGAYCADDVFYAAMPLCNANRSPIITFSTPRFKEGFFYDYFTTNKKNCFHYDWSAYKNPFLSEEKYEIIKATMPIQLFRADYLGQWMEASSDIFGDFKAVLGTQITSMEELCAGLDWGAGKASNDENSDYTAISIINKHKEQVLLRYWNDLDETQTIIRIVNILAENKVKKVVVETNSIGSIYLGLLRKEMSRRGLTCQIIQIHSDNTKKNEVYQSLIVEVQNQTIQLLPDKEQQMEMVALKQEKTRSGKITYNAQKPHHDDCIDATCYALYGLKTGTYAYR